MNKRHTNSKGYKVTDPKTIDGFRIFTRNPETPLRKLGLLCSTRRGASVPPPPGVPHASDGELLAVRTQAAMLREVVVRHKAQIWRSYSLCISE